MVTRTEAQAIQVGHVADERAITLNTSKVLAAINHLWMHQRNNPDRSVHLRFLTSARRGVERPAIASGGGLDYWDRCRQNPQLDPGPLRKFLARHTSLSTDLRRWLRSASSGDFRDRLVHRVHWDTGRGSLQKVRKAVLDGLVTFGHKQSVPPSWAERIAAQLLDLVWQAASGQRDTCLTHAEFLRAFEEASTARVPIAMLLRLGVSEIGVSNVVTQNPYLSGQSEQPSAQAAPGSYTASSSGISHATERSGPPQSHHHQPGKDRQTVKVLTYSQRRLVGLIATAPFPFTEAELAEILPDLARRPDVKWLRRRGLVTLKDGRLVAPRAVRRSITADRRDADDLDRLWVEGLIRLKYHTDVAAFLAQKLFALREHEQAVMVLTDVAENLDPGSWNQTYSEVLGALHSKHILRRISVEGRLHFCNAFGLCLTRSGKQREAIPWFQKLRLLAARLKNPWGLGQAYIHLGVAHHELGDDHAAARFYQKGIDHGRAVGDNLIVGRCLHNLAMITADADLNKAEMLLRNSLRYKERARDAQGGVGALLGLGSIAVGRRDFRRAIVHLTKAERRARKLDLRHARSTALVNLGSARLDLVRAEAKQSRLAASQKETVRDAVRCYQTATSIAQAEGFDQLLVLATQGEAVAATVIDEHASAARLFLALHRLKTRRGDTQGAISALHDAGVCAVKQGRASYGRRVIARALRLARQARSAEWVVKCHVTIAASHSRPANTRRVLRVAANLEFQLRHFDAARRIWEALALFERRHGHWDAMETLLLDAAKALTRGKGTEREVFAVYKLLFQLNRESRRLPQALDALNKLEKLAVSQRDRLETARAVDEKGVILQELDRLKPAEKAHRRALNIARAHGYEAQRATSLNNLGELLRKTGRPSEAIVAFRESEQVLRRLGDRESELSTAHNRALAIVDLGRSHQAEDLLRRIERETKRRNFPGEHVRALHGLGNLAWASRQKRLAVRRLEAALREARQLALSEDEAGIAANLAHCFRALGRSRKAIPVLRAVEGRAGRHAATVERLLALSLEDVADWNSASSCWQRLLAIAESAGDQSTIAECQAAAANIHQRTNPRLADSEFAKALEAEREPEGRALLFSEHLRLLLGLGRERAAEKAFKEARELAKEHDLEQVLVDIHMAFGDYYWSKGTRRELKALQCYVAGMVACAKPDVLSKVGVHIFGKVFGIVGGERVRRINALRTRLERWLAVQWKATADAGAVSDGIARILWPVIVAEQLAQKGMSPQHWAPERARAIIHSEIARRLSAKKEIQDRVQNLPQSQLRERRGGSVPPNASPRVTC